MNSPNQYRVLAAIHRKMGNLDRSLEILQLGLLNFPENPSIMARIGGIYALQGEYDKAEAYFKDMTESGRPEEVRREGIRQLAMNFYTYVGKFSEMEKRYDYLISMAISDKDTNSLVHYLASKSGTCIAAPREKTG